MRLALRILSSVITGLLILVIGVGAVLAFSIRRAGDSVPTVAGHKVLAVVSGSMEPVIHTGDVIVVRPLRDPATEVRDGDIITFRSKDKPDMLITHRVVGTVTANGKSVAFGTKGDANEVEDRQLVAPEQIIGVHAFRIPYFGYVTSFIRKPIGVFLFVILPGLVIIVLEFRKMWQAMSEAEAANKEAAVAEAESTEPEQESP